MMKPKAPTEQDSGMLEYIEDIIGTNRFIKPIQHFNAKAEEKNELRLEKVNISVDQEEMINTKFHVIMCCGQSYVTKTCKKTCKHGS